MALEDYLEPEVAITAAVVAAVASPKGRKIIRLGTVYGLAGILAAGDTLASIGKNLGRNIQSAGDAASHATGNMMDKTRSSSDNGTMPTSQTVNPAGTATESETNK